MTLGRISRSTPRSFASSQVVAILFMGAGQEGEAAVMLDDAIVVLSKAELLERIVEGTARGHQQHRYMQPASRLCWLCRFLLVGHALSSPGGQPSWLSPRR